MHSGQKHEHESHLEVENRHKRFVLKITFLCFLPALLVFFIVDASKGLVAEAISDAIMFTLVAVNLVLFKYIRNLLHLLRISVVIMIIQLFYALVVGSGDGNVFIWYFFFPIGAFYLFGIREGFFWVGLLFLMAILSFFVIRIYPYEAVNSLRYLLNFIIVTAMAYGLESSRRRYQARLLKEKAIAEKALEEVKTLSGLLPICASCKKIRDDKGYWNQLEDYLHVHSDVMFSHGLCPDCMKKMYGNEFEDSA